MTNESYQNPINYSNIAIVEPTPEEMAFYIGERLFGLNSIDITPFYRCGTALYPCRSLENFYKWISFPDGLNAVERAMIDRGWNIVCAYEPIRKWYCRFDKVRGVASQFTFQLTKPQAILTAAYKALKEK